MSDNQALRCRTTEFKCKVSGLVVGGEIELRKKEKQNGYGWMGEMKRENHMVRERKAEDERINKYGKDSQN